MDESTEKNLHNHSLKIIYNKIHKKITGKSNKLIINNLKKLSKLKKNIIIRFPVIPGYTDNIKNIEDVIYVMNNTGLKRIDILPYHRFGENKYKHLGMSYKLHSVPPSEVIKVISRIKNIFIEEGFMVIVGG